MEFDSIRFADQSKALWLQQNGSGLASHANGELLPDSNRKSGMSLNGMGKQSGGCLGRCPFASIIAMVITVCGTGIFCGCLYKALAITIQMLTAAFKLDFEMEWVKVVQTIVIIISTVMGTLSFVLLVVGCLSTGATRAQIYTGFRSRLGGRISTGFFTAVVYLLMLIWSTCTIVLVVPIVAYYVLMKQCEFKHLILNDNAHNRDDECLSLKHYGIQLSNAKNAICKAELEEFCGQAKEAGPLYVAAFASSALIVLGLVHYLCCLVANYAHIKDGIKLKDYEEAIKEELELRCEMAAMNRKKADL